MELKQAREIVEGMVEQLRPYCERIEIGGSIRRGNKAEVKDAEIVAIPKPNLLAYVDEMLAHGFIEKALYGEAQTHRWGPKYRGMQFNGLKIELFLADADNWGYIYWLRTGPHEANTFIMTWLKWKHAPISSREGYWWWGEKKLHIATEEDLFALLGMPFIPPANRDEQRYRMILRDWKGQWPDYARFVIAPAQDAQAGLPGMVEDVLWLEGAPIKDDEREAIFQAMRMYWWPLPGTTRMEMHRAQVDVPMDKDSIRPENLLSHDAFCQKRDTIAVEQYTARLPVLLEKCTMLRAQIDKLKENIQWLNWIRQWPEINRHDLNNKARGLEESKIERYRELQPLESEYAAIMADMPVRLKRLGLAQQVSKDAA